MMGNSYQICFVNDNHLQSTNVALSKLHLAEDDIKIAVAKLYANKSAGPDNSILV